MDNLVILFGVGLAGIFSFVVRALEQDQDHPEEEDKPVVASIFYKNWKGETRWRSIVPNAIFYGKTQWHPDLGYFLEALDMEKNEIRHFAMDDILQWHSGNEKGKKNDSDSIVVDSRAESN